MAHGPSDDELYDASQAMQDALWAMGEETGALDEVGAAATARLDHVNVIASLDPARIAEEFERMRTIASRLTQSEGARSALAQAEGRLDGWRGDAKAALLGKIENVRSHLDRMAVEAGQITNIVGTFYSLALHARQSHLLLCREIEAAAKREISNQGKRDGKLALAIGTKIVSALLDADPTKAMRSSLSAFVDIADVTVGYFIDGNDAGDVANNYLLAGNETTQYFQDALDDIHDRLRRVEGQMAWDMLESEVYQPIHSDADITSPDFRYENFASESGVPRTGFEGSVETERKRVLAEREAGESEIDRRLGGAE